jgi:hypothetical protein
MAVAGTWEVTVTVCDGSAGCGTDSFTVVVEEPNEPPVADAGADQSVSEGMTVTLDGSASADPDGDALTYAWTQLAGAPVALADPAAARPTFEAADDAVVTFRVEVTDGDETASDEVTVTVTNVAPTVAPITAPLEPVPVGTPVTMTTAVEDPGVLDTHTVRWEPGDGTSIEGGLSATHVYAEPGVYTLLVTVTDDDGGAGTARHEYVVVYDPSGGFVTGGGWIMSPEGAWSEDPTATGKATFGFVAKYQKGSKVPTGSTQFQFHAGGLDFHADHYDWLVVAGTRAQYKGTGTLNGGGDYGFLLTAVDGTPDRFRIKIWHIATGVVVYDNQRGQDDSAEPSTELGGGSIVVHAKKK